MQKHTTGLKTQRLFFAHDGKPYELIGYSYSNGTTLAIVRNLIEDESLGIIPNEVFETEFKPISQGEVFDYINNDDDNEHAEMMKSIGVGYICPFCGGRLAWESDFMASEVRGIEYAYTEIKDEMSIKFAEESLGSGNGICGVTDNIDELNDKVMMDGDYEYMYMREDKVGNDGNVHTTWWVINDPVIGIYRCTNCGKSYEIMDCPPAEEHEYPFFS